MLKYDTWHHLVSRHPAARIQMWTPPSSKYFFLPKPGAPKFYFLIFQVGLYKLIRWPTSAERTEGSKLPTLNLNFIIQYPPSHIWTKGKSKRTCGRRAKCRDLFSEYVCVISRKLFPCIVKLIRFNGKLCFWPRFFADSALRKTPKLRNVPHQQAPSPCVCVSNSQYFTTLVRSKQWHLIYCES